MTISVQGEKRQLRRSNFVDIIGSEQKLRLLSASSDIYAILLVLTENYISKLFKHKPPFPPSYVTEILKNPVMTIEENKIACILHCLDGVQETLSSPLHHFQDEILRCKIWIFFMEVAEIFISRNPFAKYLSDTDRKKVLFAQFLGAISKHIEQEHSVTFYASLLCITPQYLRRIVKECSGRIASEWINEELIRVISQLLSDTDMSIQQIAEKMHFSNQAVLSKFFKRYKGVSPLQYRNAISNV